MAMSTGLQIDVKLRSDTPPDVIMWLSKHVLLEGHMQEVNDFFKPSGKGLYPEWRGGTLRRDETNTFWHLKTNGSATSNKSMKIAFFLNELYPWVIVEPGRCIARLVNEEMPVRELIYWYTDAGRVGSRLGKLYDHDTSNPQYWDAATLAAPLPLVKDVDIRQGEKPLTYNFGKREVVSVKAEKKRILARQHNAAYVKTLPEAEEDELARMERGE